MDLCIKKFCLFQELRQENEELTKTNKELEAKSSSSTMSEAQRQELGNLHSTLSDRISEISRLNESIKTLMHNSSQNYICYCYPRLKRSGILLILGYRQTGCWHRVNINVGSAFWDGFQNQRKKSLAAKLGCRASI